MGQILLVRTKEPVFISEQWNHNFNMGHFGVKY